MTQRVCVETEQQQQISFCKERKKQKSNQAKEVVSKELASRHKVESEEKQKQRSWSGGGALPIRLHRQIRNLPSLFFSSSLFLFFCLVSQVSSQSIPSIHIFPLSFLAISKSRLVTRKSERHFIALSIRTFKLFWGERFCDVLYFPCCSVPGCPFLIIIH